VGASEYDVIVVGAGPAGASAAREAARGGARVCLLEQGREIGAPIRTSGGSFISELDALGIEPRFYHPLHRVTFESPAQRASFEFPRPVLCVLDVRALYQELARQAAEAGAEIRLGSEVVDAVRDGAAVRGVSVRREGGTDTLRARLVVDASGFSAVVQRRAGLRPPFRRFGFGAELDLYAPGCDEWEAVLIVGSSVAPAGYGWLFPRGGARARVGVGVLRPDSDAMPRDYLERLVRETWRERLRAAQPLEYHVGYFPSEGLNERFVFDGLLAVGDAAGQASTLVGEGIRYAIKAGRLAGRVAAEAIAAGDCSAARLRDYDTAWRREYGAQLRIAYAINERIARYDDARWDDKVELLRTLTPELFAQALMGDFGPGWAVRVLAHRPSLFAPLVKKLVGLG
jgi:digeranylgeranylglycerophospholipid reductase